MNKRITVFYIVIAMIMVPFLCSGTTNTIQSELGTAENFGILDLSGTNSFNFTGGRDIGNVGVSSSTQLNLFSPTLISGSVYVGNTATLNNVSGAAVNGSVFTNQNTVLNAATSSAISAAAAFTNSALFPVTSTISSITTTQTLTASTTENVYNVGSINLSNGATLTLSGAQGKQFIINVSGTMTVASGASIILTGGLTPGDVVFNVSGAFSTTTGGSNNVAINGIILDISGGVTMSGGYVNGEIIAGSYLNLFSGNFGNAFVQQNVGVPEPSTYLIIGSLLLPLIMLKRYRDRKIKQKA